MAPAPRVHKQPGCTALAGAQPCRQHHARADAQPGPRFEEAFTKLRADREQQAKALRQANARQDDEAARGLDAVSGELAGGSHATKVKQNMLRSNEQRLTQLSNEVGPWWACQA